MTLRNLHNTGLRLKVSISPRCPAWAAASPCRTSPVCYALRSTIPTKRTLRVFLKEGFTSFNCVRCGAKGYALDGTPGREITAQDERQIAAQRDRDRENDDRRFRRAYCHWAEATDFTGSPAETYLVKTRSSTYGALDLSHCLRWNDVHGCMVAKMTDAVTGRMTGIRSDLFRKGRHSTFRESRRQTRKTRDAWVERPDPPLSQRCGDFRSGPLRGHRGRAGHALIRLGPGLGRW